MKDNWSTLKKLIFHRAAVGASATYSTVTANLPTVLTAVAGRIKALIRHGFCSQSGTPTPSAPVDIVCNNGTLKMVHRSGLPSGYKLLEYVGGSGSQYVITDLYLASTDVIECEFRNSTTTGYGAVYGIFAVGESSALYGNQTYYGYNVSNNKVDTDIRVDTEWHSSRHDFVNGTLTIDDTTVSFTPFEFVNSTKNAVLSRYYNNNYGYNWRGFVRKFKVTRNGAVVCDLLPAKDSNDVAGLYDLISGNFYTATGGTLLEGNEVDDYEFAIVGTPEVLSVGTQTASVQTLYAVGDYADTHDLIRGAVTHKVGVKVLDGTEEWSKLSGYNIYFMPISDMLVCNPVKAGFSTHFVGTNASNASMPDGSVKNTYASATEGAVSIRLNSAETVEDFKAFLAAQYAAGTPVIVLYPLAEETTSSVAGQTLNTEEGSNTVSTVSEVATNSATITYRSA